MIVVYIETDIFFGDSQNSHEKHVWGVPANSAARKHDVYHYFVDIQECIKNQDSTHHSQRWVFNSVSFYLAGPDKGSESFPEYPGFEKDVFIMIRDYFESVSEPLTTHLLYPLLISIYSMSILPYSQYVMCGHSFVCLLNCCFISMQLLLLQSSLLYYRPPQ